MCHIFYPKNTMCSSVAEKYIYLLHRLPPLLTTEILLPIYIKNSVSYFTYFFGEYTNVYLKILHFSLSLLFAKHTIAFFYGGFRIKYSNIYHPFYRRKILMPLLLEK
jgi:hypothetical protein